MMMIIVMIIVMRMRMVMVMVINSMINHKSIFIANTKRVMMMFMMGA